jgi:signal transduction histidine kinase
MALTGDSTSTPQSLNLNCVNHIKRYLSEFSRTRATGYVVGAGLPLAVTVIGAKLALPAFVFEHLMVLLVVGLAVIAGGGPAIVAAVAGGIGDNILLREPIGRPAITGLRDAVDLGLFLVVAAMVGWLVDRLRNAKAEATEAADRERFAREELDRLVATLTHDLATPLAAIQGTIQFARRHAVSSDVDLSRLLGRVETAAGRATSLVRALTDAKSIQQRSLSLQLQPVDLRLVVEPIVKMLDRLSDRHPIALAIDPSPLVINGDPDRLGRVVENLIMNGIKYSPAGGTVEVCVTQHAGAISLTVRDHGIGIPPDARDRIFELGYRTPQAVGVAPGLGLGLYTAAEVIRRHGGTICVAAPEGGGATFTVLLPRAESNAYNRMGEGNSMRMESPSRAVH